MFLAEDHMISRERGPELATPILQNMPLCPKDCFESKALGI